MKTVFAMGLLLLLAGCMQAHSDDELRAVPVTNNPQVLPIGGPSPGPLF